MMAIDKVFCMASILTESLKLSANCRREFSAWNEEFRTKNRSGGLTCQFFLKHFEQSPHFDTGGDD
jgi:hypothetical protein